MLPSLRPLIAESMRDLAMSDHQVQDWQSAIRGARTLEWCDANDPDNFSEDEERVAELESALSDVRAAMVAWNTSGSTKRLAEFTKELRGILTEVGL